MQKPHSLQGLPYPALLRMKEARWTRAEWITTEDSAGRARFCELSASGKKQLAAQEPRWQISTSAQNRLEECLNRRKPVLLLSRITNLFRGERRIP